MAAPRALPPYAHTRQRLTDMIDAWRPSIASLRMQPEYAPLYLAVDAAWDKPGSRLVRLTDAMTGMYVLEVNGKRQFVIKPHDEVARGPNNAANYYRGPDTQAVRYTEGIPTLSGLQRELGAQVVARTFGLQGGSVQTIPYIADFSRFPHALTPAADPVKLCTVRPWIPNALPLSAIEPLLRANVATVDQSSYEQVLVLSWLLYDNHPTGSSILARVKNKPDMSMQQWLKLPHATRRKYPLELRKVDAVMTLPEGPTCFHNSLRLLPNYNRTMSASLRERLTQTLNVENVNFVAAQLEKLQLANSVESTAGGFLSMRILVLSRLLNASLAKMEASYVAHMKQRCTPSASSLNIAEIPLRALEMHFANNTAHLNLPAAEVAAFRQRADHALREARVGWQHHQAKWSRLHEANDASEKFPDLWILGPEHFFKGQLANNKPTGPGLLMTPKGYQIAGTMRDGQPVGAFVQTFLDGSRIDAVADQYWPRVNNTQLPTYYFPYTSPWAAYIYRGPMQYYDSAEGAGALPHGRGFLHDRTGRITDPIPCEFADGVEITGAVNGRMASA